MLVNYPLVKIAHLWELLDKISATDDIGPAKSTVNISIKVFLIFLEVQQSKVLQLDSTKVDHIFKVNVITLLGIKSKVEIT